MKNPACLQGGFFLSVTVKTKGCPTDSLFNLNQLNLINQKLTRTVSPMICLKYYFK